MTALLPDYQCPLCATALTLHSSGKHYTCQHTHSFDVAKEGYLNLLPVQFKHSLEPGDNKQMLQARRAFLESGYYAPLAEAIALLIKRNTHNTQPLRMLDLGCGEGYYSRSLAGLLAEPMTWIHYGVDIAKFAVAAAAKKQSTGHFVVASNHRLPYPDAYFDQIVRVFAPSNADELKRVLKASGLLLVVTPGPRHLWQLKEFIYTDVKEHTLEPELADGFVVMATQRIQYPITPSAEQRIALLHMTPFAWRATLDIQHTLQALVEFTVDVDFVLTLAKKSESTDANEIMG
jgi:23S rRNA (guanine745-N1)-methyltransferase